MVPYERNHGCYSDHNRRTAEELGEEKIKEIVRQRMEAAVESMGYERTQK